MQLCLYHPQFGYYTRNQPIGRQGDFTTAPELTPLFSYAIANNLIDTLQQIDQPTILEVGAGNGTMAADILLYLEKQNALPDHYIIAEISDTLIAKQQQNLQQKAPHLLARVSWQELETIKPFNGAIIANELFDALAINRYQKTVNPHGEETEGRRSNSQAHFLELKVSHQNDPFIWKKTPIESQTTTNWLNTLDQQHNFPDGYTIEHCPELPVLSKSFCKKLNQGILLFIDYGFTETEFFHPERVHGHLMAYHQHQATDNPFIAPGKQDLTCHINFTELAHLICDQNTELLGFTQQSHFLLNSKITEALEAFTDQVDYYRNAQALKQLVSPNHMGETFKVIGFAKNIEVTLPGFSFGCMKHKL